MVTQPVSCPGGNDVVWVKCAMAFACKLGDGAQVSVRASCWGFQGWEVDDGNACFAAAPRGRESISHVVFANDIANGRQQDGIVSYNEGDAGVDYFAVIGNLAYNAAQTTGNCDSGISIGGPRNTDRANGTHIYVAWNISWDNITTFCLEGQNSDLTGITFDTRNRYTGQGVLENNLLIGNGGSGFELADNSHAGTCGAPVLARYNTAGKNLQMHGYTNFSLSNSEYNFAGVSHDYCMTIVDNIAYGSRAATVKVARQALWFAPNDATPASVLDDNFLYSVGGRAISYSGTASLCRSSQAATVGPYKNAANIACPGNTLAADPDFVNPAIPGAPSCAGYRTTLRCMAATTAGWVARNPEAARKGFQTPAPTDAYNTTPFLCRIYHALPPGLIRHRC